MARKKFAKGLYIELSQEFHDFIKAHSKEFQHIYDSINEKMMEYDDKAFNWKQKAASRWREIAKLRSENKELKEASGQGVLSYTVNSVYIPKAVLFNPYFSGLPIGACILYGLILNLRLSSISKGYIDDNNVLFIDEYELIRLFNETIVSGCTYRDLIKELEQYGLIYLESVPDQDSRAIYVKVFSKEEENNILSELYASKGDRWLSDTSVR